MKQDLNSFLPLSAASLHILLSLAADDLHGYGIMQEVLRQSEGKYKLGPGTLYDNLQKLTEHSFVLELGHRAGDDDPPATLLSAQHERARCPICRDSAPGTRNSRR
jgi:hypothetical protein